MNFDTYKIKDELLEIYSGSEETFCVGKFCPKTGIVFFSDLMMRRERTMGYIL